MGCPFSCRRIGMLLRWCSKLLNLKARPSVKRARPARVVPTVEVLEDRSLLASLSIPTSFVGQPGNVIAVPVNIDASDGLQMGTVAIGWDTSRLEFVNVQPGPVTNDFFVVIPPPDTKAGTAQITLERNGAISGRGGGSVLGMNFRVKANAINGPAIINLRQNVGTFATQLNQGAIPLNPAPSNDAGDALDGRITVQGGSPPPSALTTVQSVVIGDGTAQRSRIKSLTITFSTTVRFTGNPVNAFRLTR